MSNGTSAAILVLFWKVFSELFIPMTKRVMIKTYSFSLNTKSLLPTKVLLLKPPANITRRP